MNVDDLQRAINITKQLHQIKGRKQLVNFITYTDENYDPQWFHEIACKYLDKLQSGEIKKLMMFVPPQHGKSTMSSINFPAYCLGKNPSEKIILGSYNKTKATEFTNKVRKLVKEKTYKELFPDMHLSGVDSMEYFETSQGGFLKSAGMDSGVTGTSATLLIIDDPFKGRSESNSQTIRDKVWNTYNDDFLTRLDDEGRVLMLYTRWHEDDIAGRILNEKSTYYHEKEASEWVVVVFQALKQDTLPFKTAVQYDDPRGFDEALWEEKHSRETIARRRERNPSSFNSLYQQTPTASDGNKIKRSYWVIKKENELPFNINSVTWNAIIDGAFTEDSKNDETAYGFFYYHKPDGKLYIRNLQGVRKSLPNFLTHFAESSKSNGIRPHSKTYIEPKASGKSIKQFLRLPKYGKHNAIEIPDRYIKPGKWDRAETCEASFLSEKVVLIEGNWNEELIEQAAQFPNGAHDDRFDVAMYGIQLFLINEEKKVNVRGASYS
jgi:predicted phage terminase large subunit-like protein